MKKLSNETVKLKNEVDELTKQFHTKLKDFNSIKEANKIMYYYILS